MSQVVKRRGNIGKISSFLSSYKTEQTIHVPMLYDGTIEECLSVNNKVTCIPADVKFLALWEILRDEPHTLSRFIEIYSSTVEETSANLSEVLKIQKNRVSTAYTLLCLVRRSDEEVLMGGELTDKEKVFTPEYIKAVYNYAVPFDLVTKAPKSCLTFQDLTYLTIEEVTKFSTTENSLFITNNKQHIYCFDGAECSMIDNYYLIWR